jgi:hypothetical protein
MEIIKPLLVQTVLLVVVIVIDQYPVLVTFSFTAEPTKVVRGIEGRYSRLHQPGPGAGSFTPGQLHCFRL